MTDLERIQLISLLVDVVIRLDEAGYVSTADRVCNHELDRLLRGPSTE